MGDSGINFKFDQFEKVVQIQFNAPTSTVTVSPVEARKTLEEAVRKIPDSALRGLRSFRIMIAT
jgi:hypothetical protein